MSNSKHNIQIVEFSDELSKPIKTLNYKWLEKYFRVEEGDIVSLSNPKKYIIDKADTFTMQSLMAKLLEQLHY